MKTNKLWSIMMMLLLVIGTTVAISSCSKKDKDEAGSATGIYGTWCSVLDDEYDTFINVTVIFGKNSASMTWDKPGYYKEVYLYDSFAYDESKKMITAHLYKEIYTDYRSGETEESSRDRTGEILVTWIDNNHIQLGSDPGVINDFDILERSK